MYIVQFNDGRTLTVPSGEAKFWAWLSMDFIVCNVYKRDGGCAMTLSPFDIH